MLGAASVLAAVLTATFLGGAQDSASGIQTPMEELTIDIRVEADGALSVRETQRYDFGATAPTTLRREFPTRVRHDDDHEQVYDIAAVEARLGHEPVDFTLESSGGVTTVLMDLDEASAGEQAVTLRYRVRGTVRATPEGLELAWQAVRGFGRIESVAVTVSAPAVTWAACFAGQTGSSMPCTAAQITDVTRPRFDQHDLPPGGQMTIIVGIPPEAGVTPDQRLVRRWSVARAFAVTPVSLGLMGGLVVLAALGVLALWRTRGRDRPADETELPVAPLEPPDAVQPGQLGTVVNQRADVVDVVATVLDLAVRGQLRIEQTLEDAHLAWRLHRTVASYDDLHGYERVVLDRLFEGGRDHVTLAEVAEQMRLGLPAIQDGLYADVVAQGWFVERPDAARSRWTTAGLVLALAGVVITAVLAAFTDLGLVGLGLIASGAILAWGGEVAPARAPRGSALLPRLHDFREELATVDVSTVAVTTADRLLPFAVVFGVEDRWMAAAAASASLPTDLQDFVTTLSGVISARRVRI